MNWCNCVQDTQYLVFIILSYDRQVNKTRFLHLLHCVVRAEGSVGKPVQARRQKQVLVAETMDKSENKHSTNEHRSKFCVKLTLLVLCVIVAVQFALIAKCFDALKDLNNKFHVLEKKYTTGSKPLRTGTHQQGLERRKRSSEETEYNKLLVKPQHVQLERR
jgi:hypothetical protein